MNAFDYWYPCMSESSGVDGEFHPGELVSS